MSSGTTLWILLLAALAILFVLVLRRMSRLIARTHELERFQRVAGQLDRRFAEAADPVVSRLDEIRRRGGDPHALAAELPAAYDAVRAAAAEAQSSLRAPVALASHAAALVRELERAVRALELVEHGLDSLVAARGPRELEAQVSLKRGALNLRHARGAFTATARAIAAVGPADLAVAAQARASRPSGMVPTYIVDGIDPEPERSFDPRM